jgi:hypothetical protein
MLYISEEEFSIEERKGKVGTILWPDWHYGVLLLYGQHLALNHLIATNQINLVKLEDLLDFPSANKESIFKKLHIHVFHGDDIFSKFQFKASKYDNLTSQVNEYDVKQVKYYCLKMALESKNSTNSLLYQMYSNRTSTKM